MPEDFFDSLDLRRAALLGWINLTLAALSKAEKAACRFFALVVVLAFLIRDLRIFARFLLRAVLVLSLRTFLIADRIIGIIAKY